MKIVLSIIIMASVFYTKAQENIFLGREFWTESTTVEDVKSAIEEGNSPTEFSSFNFDAIVYAILENAPLKTIEYLLTIKGNEVSKITHDGRNYLMWAGYKDNYPLILKLLEMGSDIEVIDDKGNNVVTFTAYGGSVNPKIYEALKKYGMPLTTPNRQGATAIHYLAQNVQKLEEIDFLIAEGLDLKAVDHNKNTVFHYAASQGNTKLLQQLIDKGFDPKSQNINNENAMFFSARGKRGFQNDVAVFKYLESKGLDIKIENNSKNNVLHYLASGNKNKVVLEFAITNGVNVQTVNNEGNNPLMIAVARNNSTAIDLLFERTKEKNLVNTDGYSMFTYALRNKNKELIETLEKSSVNYMLVDKNDQNLITHLVQTYKETDQAFFENQFSKLKKNGVQIQAQTLHFATAFESEYLINYLLKNGADINAKNKEGINALQLAAMKGNHPEFLKFLLEKGADKSVKTEFDESVYELAKSNELLIGDLNFLK